MRKDYIKRYKNMQHVVQFRESDEGLEKLRKDAEKAGLTMSEYIRVLTKTDAVSLAKDREEMEKIIENL